MTNKVDKRGSARKGERSSRRPAYTQVRSAVSRNKIQESRRERPVEIVAPVFSLDKIEKALSLRDELLRVDHNAFRLLDGGAEGQDGLVIDRLDNIAVINVEHSAYLPSLGQLEPLLKKRGIDTAFLKLRAKVDLRKQDQEELAPSKPLFGNDCGEEHLVWENGLRIATYPADGLSYGLFLDQSANRQKLKKLAASGKRMLNLFSYTCAFSVAAGQGGAEEVVSVDLSGRALQRGKRNIELNGLAPQKFIKEDAFKWLARALRRSERYDLIVLDPPSFGTRKNTVFRLNEDYQWLLQAVEELLSPGGTALCVTNHRGTSEEQFRSWIEERFGKGASIEKPVTPPDCPSLKLGLTTKHLWIKR